ncbi:alcohol dehydrogenase [Fusarium napiforme]|uniref:Alcohol dehydrogenase n=1 Tax=Fusarium napiforme TaxID=42672 RepID=A0A8H5JIP3_9HYPO|nr:alcohol dehydrogenase [Fusarium napiforme]
MMEEIPKKHKAIVYSNPGTIATRMVEVDTPSPKKDEILVRLTYPKGSGKSPPSSPLSFQFGAALTEYQIGGHEGVGYVVQLGQDVTNVTLGDRVGVKWITSACLVCSNCLEGFDNKCERRKVAGYKTPGTFQQYIVTDPRYATPIPGSLSSEAAAPLLCGGVTVWSALQSARCRLGDWVGISGAGGGLGHLAIQYAKAFGYRVLAIDSSAKETFCHGVGADIFLDYAQFDSSDLALKVKELTGGGCHSVLVCNSSSAAYDQALGLLRYAGTLVCVGIPEVDAHPIPDTAPYKMIMNQWSIKGEQSSFYPTIERPLAHWYDSQELLLAIVSWP